MSQFFQYFGSTLNYLLIAAMLFVGGSFDDHIGEGGNAATFISKTTAVVLKLIFTLTTFPAIMDEYSKFVGYARRVNQLYQSLLCCSDKEQQLDSSVSLTNNNMLEKDDSNIDEISFKNTNISVPNSDNDPLISELNLVITKGTNLIIMGPNGAGKTAIIRYLAGIWRPCFGSIKIGVSLDNPRQIIVMAQKSYLPSIRGSLINLMTFPILASNSKALEDEYHSWMDFLQLSHLKNYSVSSSLKLVNQVSPGELQKLLFLRVLYYKPSFLGKSFHVFGILMFISPLVMDESMAFMEPSMQAAIYERLAALNVTCITVSHDQSLIPNHSLMLLLQKDRSYKIVNRQ